MGDAETSGSNRLRASCISPRAGERACCGGRPPDAPPREEGRARSGGPRDAPRREEGRAQSGCSRPDAPRREAAVATAIAPSDWRWRAAHPPRSALPGASAPAAAAATCRTAPVCRWVAAAAIPAMRAAAEAWAPRAEAPAQSASRWEADAPPTSISKALLRGQAPGHRRHHRHGRRKQGPPALTSKPLSEAPTEPLLAPWAASSARRQAPRSAPPALPLSASSAPGWRQPRPQTVTRRPSGGTHRRLSSPSERLKATRAAPETQRTQALACEGDPRRARDKWR